MSETGKASPSPASTAVPIQVWVHGVFPAGIEDDARRTAAAVVAESVPAVRSVRVRLGAHRDPAVHFPVVAQGNVELAGDLDAGDLAAGPGPAGGLVRAQVNAATGREGITLLGARLRYQLDRAGPASAGFRHLPLPHPWVAPFPRAAQARQIVRIKPWRLERLGVDDAVRVMELRDYGFHLFVEAGSGQDSVVYHAGTAGYRLAQLLPAPERLAPHGVTLTCFDRPAPALRPAEAADRMGMCEVAFLFFRDTDRLRGSVLYRRYDGHYGLICPPA